MNSYFHLIDSSAKARLIIRINNHSIATYSCQEGIAEVNDSITYVVCSLARKVEESMLALQLLLQLSKITNVRNLIGGAQGCILLLVTLANSDDAQASKYAQELLDSLAFLDENVVQMARAKFFRPLLQRLFEGKASKLSCNNSLVSLCFCLPSKSRYNVDELIHRTCDHTSNHGGHIS